MKSEQDSPEKRSGKDRRQRKTPPLKYLLFGGRRVGNRRDTDGEGIIFVDKYNPKYLIIIIGIMILSFSDTFFTLYFVGHGAQKLNPLMGYLLNINPWLFLTAKFFLTSFGVICILIFSKMYFKPFSVRISSFFTGILVVLVLVLLWQLSMKFSMALSQYEIITFIV
jgi:hypothetical protein